MLSRSFERTMERERTRYLKERKGRVALTVNVTSVSHCDQHSRGPWWWHRPNNYTGAPWKISSPVRSYRVPWFRAVTLPAATCHGKPASWLRDLTFLPSGTWVASLFSRKVVILLNHLRTSIFLAIKFTFCTGLIWNKLYVSMYTLKILLCWEPLHPNPYFFPWRNMYS